MTEYFNRVTEKALRRALRNNMPRAEVILWSRLKGKQISGFKFRRQYSVGPFVIDFYCPELKLAIEVDGESHLHEEAPTRDAWRQIYVERLGIRFLRFLNGEVRGNLDGVVKSIEDEVLRLSGGD